MRWNAHILERMNHSYEQVLLFCVREEFHVPFSAVVADHGEACGGQYIACMVLHLDEAPVHLEGFSRWCRIPASTVSLRFDEMPFGRDKMSVLADVDLHSSQSSAVAGF